MGMSEKIILWINVCYGVWMKVGITAMSVGTSHGYLLIFKGCLDLKIKADKSVSQSMILLFADIFF